MTKYGMLIDTTKCIGCKACVSACKTKNNLPNDVFWNRVEQVGNPTYDCPAKLDDGSLILEYIPISCQHCANPSCVAVCPTGASYKREDGIVVVDQDRCIGCRACAMACPYNVRTYLSSQPEYFLDFAMGEWDAPEHIANTVEKCTFCVNRIERGMVPACMWCCPGRARFWGDLDDPSSEISQYMQGKDVRQLKPESGNDPQCYYVYSNKLQAYLDKA
ncbi:MAG: 4Fe-4S dicluster domain-containing protein [Eggerthellaceae bacterium]|nr:4Fe-4S dicluster domain-containing protein [Eggerthellaceae bacterium]